MTAILGEKSTHAAIIKMLAGIFLAVTVVRPLGDFRVGNLNDYFGDLNAGGEAAAASGIQMSQEAISSIIKSETEAYILDKAASLGVTLSVEVMVENGSVPQLSGVQLSGQVSPYARQQLSAMITDDLGIARENQEWIGQD